MELMIVKTFKEAPGIIKKKRGGTSVSLISVLLRALLYVATWTNVTPFRQY